MTVASKLVLERRDPDDDTKVIGAGDVQIAFPPLHEESYWSYRVVLSDKQAIIGFPYALTIGIGFAVEGEDLWDVHLPYTCDTEEIYQHIRKANEDKRIKKDKIRKAIRMIQDAAAEGSAR